MLVPTLHWHSTSVWWLYGVTQDEVVIGSFSPWTPFPQLSNPSRVIWQTLPRSRTVARPLTSSH